MLDQASALLKKHEGLRLKPYADTAGKLTIGYGWNLTDRGLPDDIIDSLFWKAFNEAAAVFETCGFYKRLTDARKAVVINMVFNLGPTGFAKFKRMIEALDREDYLTAATEMLDSRWAKQVGNRANELAALMKTGCWGNE